MDLLSIQGFFKFHFIILKFENLSLNFDPPVLKKPCCH